jgi:RNA-directed DNA polymerase
MTYERRYQFVIFSQPWFLHGRRRARRHPPAARSSGSPFRDLVDPENLLAVFNSLRSTRGRSPGVDGFSYGDFSRGEIADVLRAGSRAILAGTYRPQPTRAVPLEKPSGGFRELHIPTVVDRVVSSAVTEYLTPLIDPQFSPRSFGFRPRRGIRSLLVELERLVLSEGLVVLAQDDIRQAFDNVPINLALECFARHVSDADLLNLVGVTLRGHAGCNKTVGLDQGNPLSPLALNVVLDHVLDQPSAADPTRPTVLRYADNIVVVARTVAEARQALERTAELLLPQGLSLKGENNRPTILTRQGARANLLGFQVGMDDGRLRITPGPEAYRNLERALDRAHATDNPPQRAKEVTRGWIASCAPGFESAEVRQIVSRIRLTATRKGFREGHGEGVLEEWIRDAGHRWTAFRNSSSPPTPNAVTPSDTRDRSEEVSALRADASEVPF